MVDPMRPLLPGDNGYDVIVQFAIARRELHLLAAAVAAAYAALAHASAR
jgi:hypothetical protein